MTHLHLAALQIMVKEFCTATSRMTSVQKPLKFLQPHYPLLKVMNKTLAGTNAKSTTNNQGGGCSYPMIIPSRSRS